MAPRPTARELARCALVVVDVQKAFEDPAFGPRDNPDCEANVGRLIASWRRARRPVVLVRHHDPPSLAPTSPFATKAGRRFKPGIDGHADLLVTKSVHSAFYGRPRLERWLRSHKVDAVAVCGITTDHCCDTTARMASDLGFRTYFVRDAVHTFDRRAPDGRRIPAREVARRVAASLDGEFATVVTTEALARAR